ncbi:expressed unknown protein [Seminavis robusta]|uniref:Uncharacterized protein n=1 Tax=Seminavis robusta TaxID=568900 RepID=A0A9N8EVI4_9STRA|nr:expressed unknown protein [Seminavis robusta]|eukprot:Sro2001_g310300.1 n/a (407) ;mRNA; f:5902-7311
MEVTDTTESSRKDTLPDGIHDNNDDEEATVKASNFDPNRTSKDRRIEELKTTMDSKPTEPAFSELGLLRRGIVEGWITRENMRNAAEEQFFDRVISELLNAGEWNQSRRQLSDEAAADGHNARSTTTSSPTKDEQAAISATNTPHDDEGHCVDMEASSVTATKADSSPDELGDAAGLSSLTNSHEAPMHNFQQLEQFDLKGWTDINGKDKPRPENNVTPSQMDDSMVDSALSIVGTTTQAPKNSYREDDVTTEPDSMIPGSDQATNNTAAMDETEVFSPTETDEDAEPMDIDTHGNEGIGEPGRSTVSTNNEGDLSASNDNRPSLPNNETAMDETHVLSPTGGVEPLDMGNDGNKGSDEPVTNVKIDGELSAINSNDNRLHFSDDGTGEAMKGNQTLPANGCCAIL